MTMEKGSVVKLSDVWLERSYKRDKESLRRGTIKSPGKVSSPFVYVVWEGTKTAQRYHKDFIVEAE